MTFLSQLNRFILSVPRAFIGGPSYAQYMFWSQAPTELNAQMVWDKFTQPAHPLYEALLTHYPPGFVRNILRDTYVARLDRIKGISKHYDVSNDFYKLFLDKAYMFYTCADFVSSSDTLEDAQENKANYILNLIDPQPGEKILDLGCGWGSMMKKVYSVTKDTKNLVGYTLAEEQRRFIEEEYGFNVVFKDFVTANYEPNSLDKIYSIGAVEHIPKAKLLTVAQKLAAAIKPTGRIVHHFFCQMGDTLPTRLMAGADVFPGVELVSLQHHLDIFEQVGLQVNHHSLHDYRPTLRAWFDRLVANKDEAIRLVGAQTYNKYLCYLAVAWRLFENRDLMLTRFLLQRKDVPIMRMSDVSESKVRPRVFQTSSVT